MISGSSSSCQQWVNQSDEAIGGKPGPTKPIDSLTEREGSLTIEHFMNEYLIKMESDPK